MSNRRISGGAIVAAFLAVPLVAVNGGWCFAALWRWFVHPLGVPTIGVFHAIGLCALVGLLKLGLKSTSTKWKTDEDVVASIIVAFLGPWFAVLMGLVASRLM